MEEENEARKPEEDCEVGAGVVVEVAVGIGAAPDKGGLELEEARKEEDKRVKKERYVCKTETKA